MKNTIKDYFHFTASERKGAFTLLCICFFLFILPRVFPLLKTPSDCDSQVFDAMIQSIDSLAIKTPTISKDSIPLFTFDPNTITEENLLQLGLPSATVRGIINYRKSGGKFRKRDDLLKIYTMTTADYNRLADFIQIKPTSLPQKAALPVKSSTVSLAAFDPNTVKDSQLRQFGLPEKTISTWLNYLKKGGRFYKKEEVQKLYHLSKEDYQKLLPYIDLEEKQPIDKIASLIIDINQASASEWIQLKGIGPAYSRMIVNFREKLGGFASIEQVGETYGLPDSTFEKIRPQLINSPILQKILINKATVEQMQAHPYINWKKAKVIINYRREHGPFNSVEDMEKMKAISAEWLQQISPYLSFE